MTPQPATIEGSADDVVVHDSREFASRAARMRVILLPGDCFQYLDALRGYGTLTDTVPGSSLQGHIRMANTTTTNQVRISPEQRKAAAGQFERANQVIATGNFDYGIQLLLNCCKIDPASLVYRQTLRKTEKTKFNNNMRGSALAFLTTFSSRISLKKAERAENYLAVLEHGERILLRNPWDVGVQLVMAEAFRALGLLDMAIWTLDQARQTEPQSVRVNRAMARAYEERGNFTQAIALWDLVRKANPRDEEAQDKMKDLAASATIAKGKYEENIQKNISPIAAALQETQAEHEAVAQTKAHPTAERGNREVNNLQARIDADPKDVHAHLQLANHYRRRDQIDQARAVLQRGLQAAGNHFDLAIEFADLEVEPFRKNLEIAEAKLKERPDSEKLRTIRAKLIREISLRELDIVRQKADRFPTDMNFRFQMGVRLLRIGQIDEAIKEMQQARNDPRLHGTALMYLGYCFKERKNWRLAQRNFEEALQHVPPGEEALRKDIMFELAKGYADAGDLARAVEQGYELANLDFTHRDIGKLIDEWQTRLQQA